MSIQSTAAPRFARIPVAAKRNGIGRTTLYKIAREHEGLFRKLDAMTLVDLQMLDEILAELPPADLSAAAS